MRSLVSRPAAAISGLGLVASSLAMVAVAAAPAANSAGTGLVISEVYGGGGNSGATYTHDFIELYNPSDTPVGLTGHVVEYFASNGNSGGITELAGSVPARGHFLIQQAQGAGGTQPLPTPDDDGTLPMSGSNGSVSYTHLTLPTKRIV